MAVAACLADLQEETGCPGCLDYLRDPVTIDCGHNFCFSCITQRWAGLQDMLPCPVCLHHCRDRDFKRNTQLSHMTAIAMQLPTRRSRRKRQETRPLCEKHNQTLTLFCEQDLELLCAQCRGSSDHRDHHLMALKRAAASHRKKLKSSVARLRKEVGGAEEGLQTQVSKSLQLKMEVENQRIDLYSEFEQLMRLLGKEQDAIFWGSMMEEKDLQEKVIENNMRISEHISTLKNLLSEITEKYVESKLELLTGIDNIYKSYESFKTPAVFSYELKKGTYSLPPQYFGLQKMMDTFKVDLTFDPATAHPNLVISDNGKSVTYGREEPNFPNNPKRFTSLPAVLTSEGFDRARHFWQVEVRGRGEWRLGVCRDSFPRNAVPSSLPKDGCWRIHQETNTCGARDTVEHVWVGIFLDCDLGEVSFYNMCDRTHMCTFTDTFTDKLWPFFSVGPSSNSLTLCIATDVC